MKKLYSCVGGNVKKGWATFQYIANVSHNTGL